MKRALKNYAKSVKEIYNEGEFSEYSFRYALENLLKNILNGYDVKIIHESGREDFGTPDFKIKGKGKIVGYIETKKIDVDLHRLQKRDKEQLERYKENIENLILTNYKEFILYQNREKVEDVVILDDDLNLIEANIEKFERLIERFLSLSTPEIKDPTKLAEFLAKRARLLRDAILENLDENEEIKALYEAFKEHLISDMKKEEFADAYAQTIVYGLFMARFNIEGDLTKEKVAFKGIPKSLGVIHKIFKHIASDLPDYLDWIVDEIITILNNIDIKKIEESFKISGKEDAFLHFYEDFLASYNPELRKSKGVYYTPLPVVEFIVNSVDEILRDRFGKRLHDENVRILDPATGTGTFLAVVLKRVHKNVKHTLFQAYLKERLLKNIYGFEILISPYLVAHLKLSMLLHNWHITLRGEERFNIYLTNALDLMRSPKQSGLFERVLDKEREEADKVKKEVNIFAVIGNPPYETRKDETYIQNLLKDYINGLGVEKERSRNALQDDYVKFIRFAQWKIEQNGKGIVGFITNNSYLDGLVHRRMRQCLMEVFDEIYILNLHGNVRRGEKDENVFDIQQGVCIGIFIKLREGRHKAEDCKVYYYSIVHDAGLTKREEKYEFLENNTVKTVEWKEINPKEPYYFFVPKDLSLEEEYNKFLKLDEIFEINSSGVETQNDSVAIAYTPEEMKKRIMDFVNLNEDELRKKYNIKDKSTWKLKTAKEAILEDYRIFDNDFNKMFEKRLKPNLYRPFDIRWTYYHPKSSKFIGRPRYNVMKHFILGENIGFVLPKLSIYDGVLSTYVLITDKPADKHALLASKAVVNRSITVVIPLYQYIENKITKEVQKVPNIKKDILKLIKQKYNATPEDFLYYIYAILHDPKYREKYKEFLKIDFPRIPLYDKETFEKYKEIGKKLVELHLMKNIPTIDPDIDGDNLKVESVKYDKKKKGVKINKETILLGIDEDVWEFKIGGYKVIEKYLKGRKGKKLTIDELEHICKVVYIIKETIKLMKELEKIGNSF
ncbi:type ISP restriction/modification enzyme [Methanocaldococcus fervens]|uniref:site-specific DNA-methyltransferase (adenine-specific) n=1 Tax=Methanocaldococcus fervens (strain DSM 4213 / JCM 15782 / AG86) TaxID=573064 RepID=C7P6K4_METFA|nr:type ISP restriction/modification enzyme [Methanocaldococcus fervens]ACV24186.1 N-6 DNA methylase [Methanocaldococcus fervens AG86]